jgi:DNA-binding transcriptional MerR regulator
MKYLIKDLSHMTGISGARIRKWQERYQIFSPEQEENGYYYYSNDDYRILEIIKKSLSEGKKISTIMQLGREKLLETGNFENFTELEMMLIEWISESQYTKLEKLLNKSKKELSLSKFIRSEIRPLIEICGKAWQQGHITVANEYTFSRWIAAYIMNICNKRKTDKLPIWLVAAFPSELHELGALMHYAILLDYGIPTQFVGNLPIEHLIKEIRQNNYRNLSLSITIPRNLKQIIRIKSYIKSRTNVKKIFLGGRGYHISKKKEQRNES